MKFEIKSRWIGSVLFSIDTESMRLALEAAVRSKADLRGADLGWANLGEADLRGADLRGANLGGANLRGANLGGANLGWANLRGANLGGADLGWANLGGANLRGANLGGANLGWANLGEADLRGADLGWANLGGANLRGADLGWANLGGANLRGANLTTIRDDLWAVLSSTPAEVVGLRSAIMEGRIDGSTYEGDCACLVGTLANLRHCKYDEIPALKPNSSRPIELFFLSIRKGDTPETSQFSKLALKWIDEWLGRMRAAFPVA